MNAEEKRLLIKVLCEMLPYEVKGLHRGEIQRLLIMDSFGSYQVNEYDAWFDLKTVPFKPCLRPMSSMTEEELKEFRACSCVYDLHPDFHPMMCNIANELNMFDWLNEHHFDYRGLIKRGLALEASEGMYKTK